ncbi:PhzF family phenazine biosynthesis protein [Massilia sp. Leaf139]|uniref:PhzF family phenazine biosynthesis protein n=1 Tax=Massilia sp. Leaf139 TaxID=1736272 RepID=UPI0006F9FEEF|nr:PhzF family phenazine biosynthesis protein [Massilia sp. Leaf139]KQQ96493.1 phenazine biosynthesis protein PhzF family protein [Massilia sp. Leaf139]
MNITAFTCFAADDGGGNPALMIEDGPAGQAEREALARGHARTCVFIDAAAEDGIDATLDFVYPHMRSPLCLHATLAAARVLFACHGKAPLRVRTAMRGQQLLLSQEGEDVFVALARQEAPRVEADAALCARLLAAPGLDLASAPVVASVGSPKLLLEVKDIETLYCLAPDLAAIAAWGREQGVNGCYVWCRTDDGTYEGRNFNHLDPQLEDSATGVAAGALTVALGHGLLLRQGRATGRACLIRTALADDAVLVGGRVA